MVKKLAFRLFVACAACLSWRSASGQAVDAPPSTGAAGTFSRTFNLRQAVKAPPPYQIVLRSRSGGVTPERNKNAQTGGGYIQVIQVEPNMVLVLMRGAVAAGAGFAGSGHREGSAAMQLELNQDFEVVATRTGLRPPRMIVTAWLIGALLSSQEEPGGTAEHSPACASIKSADQPLVKMCIKPHSVTGGQNLLVNDRLGPMEMTLAPGEYHLHQTLAISAFQPKIACHSGSAAADFDPDPRLDTRWNEVLKLFRAAPHQDFGFRIVLQVMEEGTVPRVVIPELPAPTPEEKKKPPTDETPAKP